MSELRKVRPGFTLEIRLSFPTTNLFDHLIEGDAFGAQSALRAADMPEANRMMLQMLAVFAEHGPRVSATAEAPA